MKRSVIPDDWNPTPGDYQCGDLLVRATQPTGETFWYGGPLDDKPGRGRFLRSCQCGGWFAADLDQFVTAPPARARPRPADLPCP